MCIGRQWFKIQAWLLLVTKYYFIRKNKIVHCRETGKKGDYKRVWYKQKICSDSWTPYDIHADSIAKQLEKELKEGKLTLIPEKLMQKNIDAWKEDKSDTEGKSDEVRE